MEAGQGEERAGEEVGADGDAVGIQARILRHLADEKDGSQHDARHPPREEATLIVPREAFFAQIDGAAARKKKQAEEQRARYVEVVRTRARTAGAIFEEGHDQRPEERGLAEDERRDSNDWSSPVSGRIRPCFDGFEAVL